MIPKFLSATAAITASSLGNHVWQSTLFTCVIALLVWTLRNNHAQIRYWLWLTASLKFLVPFSLLSGIGSYLAPHSASVSPKAGLYFAMEQAGHPFTYPVISSAPHANASALSQNLAYLLPTLLVVWLCGFVIVLFVWGVRWRRISATAHAATQLRDGRELEALRRLDAVAPMSKPIEIRSSHTSLEPGVFGTVSPILLWPHGISERLEDRHLDAILAHELLHIRRRDNLAAAMHMLVEAVFWFHPLVWWLGTRLVEERERACDEEVLKLGSNRQVYAESILRICEFCVGSPLPCVSGVTGADLKRRIVRIMSERVARKLDFRRKLLLIAAAILAVAAPIVAGVLHPTAGRATPQAQNTSSGGPAYASVTITPNESHSEMVTLMVGPDKFASKNASLQQVIRVAYSVEDDRIVGAPRWLESEKYDIEAIERGSGDDPRKLGFEQAAAKQRSMLQALLADRLKLAIHRETKEITAYALMIAKNGPKLQEAKPGDTYPNSFKGPDGIARSGGIHFDGQRQIAQGVPIGALLFHLSRQLHRTLLDETGLSGTYDFTLKLPDSVPLGIDTPTPPDSYEPAVSAAIEQQLGLKLEPKKVELEVLVIDHVERP